MTDNLKSIVFMALGEASMCWSDIDKAGVFESSRCEDVGNRLIAEINSVLKPQTSEISEAGKQNTTQPCQNGTAGKPKVANVSTSA